MRGNKVSSSAIIVLSVCLLVTGGMILDPLAGFICFVLSGGLALLATMKDKGRIRYAAIIVLCAAGLMVLLEAPDAITHYHTYQKGKQAAAK